MQMAIIMATDKGTGPWIGVVIIATHRQPDRQQPSPAWLMNSCSPREYPAAAPSLPSRPRCLRSPPTCAVRDDAAGAR